MTIARRQFVDCMGTSASGSAATTPNYPTSDEEDNAAQPSRGQRPATIRAFLIAFRASAFSVPDERITSVGPVARRRFLPQTARAM